MTTPRSLGDKPVLDLPALLAFVNQLWLPDYRLLRRKLGGMLSQPGTFAVPVWDGATWHAAQVGSFGGNLPNADSLVDPVDGTVWLGREGVITAPRTYTPVVGGNYDSLTFWNLTTQYTITIVLFGGDMELPPGYVGRIHGDPSTYVGVYREPVTIDPEKFG